MKKELMLSAPCFNKKNKSRDFDPGIVKKIFDDGEKETEPEQVEVEKEKPKKPRTRSSKPKVEEVTENE